MKIRLIAAGVTLLFALTLAGVVTLAVIYQEFISVLGFILLFITSLVLVYHGVRDVLQDYYK